MSELSEAAAAFGEQVAILEEKVGVLDESTISPLIDEAVITQGRVYGEAAVKATTTWKVYILRYVHAILETYSIRTQNKRKFVIRYVATLFSGEFNYLTDDDEKNPSSRPALEYYVRMKGLLKIAEMDYADHSTRNLLVSDILNVYIKFQGYTWGGVEKEISTLTWARIRRHVLGQPPAPGKRDKPSGDCDCEFCASDIGVCLNTLAGKMDNKLKKKSAEGKEKVVEALLDFLWERYGREMDAIDKRITEADEDAEMVDAISEGMAKMSKPGAGGEQVKKKTPPKGKTPAKKKTPPKEKTPKKPKNK
jgi:hypothetical protein